MAGKVKIVCVMIRYCQAHDAGPAKQKSLLSTHQKQHLIQISHWVEKYKRGGYAHGIAPTEKDD